MTPRISITKKHDIHSQELVIHVELVCSKEDILSLLSYGTSCILESTGIKFYEYLEALMYAREANPHCRTMIDLSSMRRIENIDDE